MSLKDKYNKILPTLQKDLGVKNVMATPKVMKVTINSGVGRMKDKKQLELVANRLAKITGQKPSPRPAKKSIASFKTRQGDTVGMLVTLRGVRMWGFLDKLLNIAIPRTRDFRGLDPKNIDEMGNMTLGVKEHTVFPETADEDLRDVFGFSITITTTAKNRTAAEALFRALGFPFKKK